MSQMLSMMKPLPPDVEYHMEFFVEDLEYLPHTIYHIIRKTLWPVKGHSSAAKLEGAMKTLVFYIFNGISFNGQDFFIRKLAASGSDIFGLKFYAPWVMRLIKRHSAFNYQLSARNHLIFLPEVDLSVEAIYPEPAKDPIYLHNVDHQSFTQPIEGVPAVSRVYPLAGNTRAPRAQNDTTGSTIAQRPQRRSHVLNDKSFSSCYTRNRTNITTGLSVRCKASWWMSSAFTILPPKMPLSLMKPVGGRGRL